MDNTEVEECKYYNEDNESCFVNSEDGDIAYCCDDAMCYFKQLAQANARIKRMRKALNKIRDIELDSLDIDWDEYEAGCRETDYSAIITHCEIGLGEADDI